MADEKIVTNVVATSDFSGLIADVQRTTAALSKLQQELSLSNKTLAVQAGQIQKAFGETLRSTGQFTTHFVTVGSEVENFGKKLDGGKLKLGDYFRTWQQHTKTSSGLIRDLAKQQVALQNAIVQPLGKAADGMMKFNVHVANGLDTATNKTALARKELQIYNKVIQDGGVQLINWGKNTQWAGRQLTVGLTVPLAAFGAAAAKAFREADQELVRLQKVYGGLSAVSAQELAKVRKDVSDTAKELAGMYGSSYKETIGLAADIAATGKQGNELLQSTREATRLSILGEVDRQEAMKATLAIQSAFKQNTEQLSESINFLNAVENQTSTSLADLVEAIPKAGPVVKALGGDIEDLALYLTAMREGGINASEGANALKSALASIINPTKVAKEQFMSFGIDLAGIVTKNAGNLTGTILEIQSALDMLDPLKKSQAIEQLFGKFQFARMNALFENLGKQGSQTLQVLDLMKASSQDLANVAGRELGQITESASGQYKRAIESLKADLAGVGDQFLKIGTFFIKVVDGVLKFVNKMPDPIKNLLGLLGGITALAGPLIMLTGVFANFIGYVIKGIGHIRALGKGGEGFKLLTPQILAAEKAGSLIEKTFYSDAEAANILSIALSNLSKEYTVLQQKAMSGAVSAQPIISTIAGNVVVEGSERVADPTSPYIGKPYSRQMSHTRPVASMSTEEKAAQNIFGVVPGPGPVNQKIGKNPQIYMTNDLPDVNGLTRVSGVSTGIVSQEAAKWHSMTAALAMQSNEEIVLLKKEVAATGAITSSLADSYQILLPQISELTTLAATESSAIVAQLNSGKITVDAARTKIIALNQNLEAMIAETVQATATTMGRTANLNIVPLTGQPVVDPITGKSNMKEMFHKSSTSKLVDKIARSLGVRTSGGGYSMETTKPRRFAMGGDVEAFGPNKTRVSGPASINYDDRMGSVPLGGYVLNQQASLNPANKDLVAMAPMTYNQGGDTMNALLTPKETVFGPGIHNNPELYAAVEAANNGFSLGGRIKANKGFYGMKLGNLVRGVTRDRDRVRQIFGINVKGSDTEAFVSQIAEVADARQREMYYTVTRQFANKQSRSRNVDPRYQVTRKAKTLDNTKIEHLNDLYERWGLPALPAAPRYHDTHMTVSNLLGKGRSLVSRYVVNYSAGSNLAANQNNLSVADLFKRDLIKRAGINKYEKQLKAAGIPKSQWDEAETNIDNSIRGFFEAEAAQSGVGIDGLPRIGDRPGRATYTFAQHFIPLLEKELERLKPFSTRVGGYQDLKKNTILRNVGGPIGENKNYYGIKRLPTSVIERLTARWPKKKPAYRQGLQYTLGNTDPLHGPLQIGMSQNLKRYSGYDPNANPAERILYRDEFNRIATSPGFLVGDETRRGLYSTARYMSGDLDIMSQMERLKNHPLGPIAAMKGLQTKFSGKLYRGILGQSTQNPLPKHILEAVLLAKQTGDWSALLGKEFIMRRSSWSRDQEVASAFAMRNQRPDSVLLEAAVKNRNILDASSLFPGKAYQAPYGQSYNTGRFGTGAKNEQEAIFGGKFRITGYSNGKLQLETVAEAREMGGDVTSGKPYLVGEKGPELFVPRNSGGIIPNYALGGNIMRGKKNYGYTALRSKIRGTGTVGRARFDEDGNPIVDPNSGMATSMAGMAMMMGGSQMPGMAGQAMTFAGMGMQMAPVLKMMTPMLKGMSTLSGLMLKVKTIGMSAFTALRIGLAALISPVGLISVAIGGLVALFLKMKKDATNAGEVNRATFGLTSSALEEVGIKYKTLSERIKEANDQLELNRARVRSSFEGYTKSGVPGLDLTLKQLKEGVANAKKEDKESVGLFDKAKTTQVNQLAASMKAQYVALGMSVQEATNQVYILIKASNKSSQALNAISSEEFKNISDRASAATYSVEMLAKVLSDKGLFNAEEFTRGLDNMLNSLDAYKNSLMETTKTQTGVSEAEALRETMEQIKKVGGDRAKLDEKTLQALKEQDLRLGYILGKAETLASVFAKTQLLFSGMASDINIKSLSPEQATKALEGYQATKEAADVILGKTAISAAAKAAEDASANAIKVLKNAEKADNSYIDTAIKNKQKLIKQLEEERNARLKILDLQEKSAGFETNIKQAQIKYQEALAAGDMAQAAQEQLNIQQLSGDRQRELARQSINDKADAERKKLEEEIERLQALKDAQAKAIVSAQNNVSKKQESAATLTGFLNEIKDAIAGFGGNTKDDIVELKELLGRIRESGRGGMVNDLFEKFGVNQGDKNPYGQLLEKLKKSTDIELKGSQYDKFDSAVKAFQDAVNKFAGIGQGSFAEPINAGTTAGQLGRSSIKWGDMLGPDSAREKVKAFAKKKGYAPGTQFTLRENDGTVKQFLVLEDGNIQLQKETKPSGRAQGGLIKGPGTGTSDSIAAMVMPPAPGFAGGGMPIRISDGEYIIKASTVQKYGVDFFDQLNAQRFAGGGRAKRKKNNVVYVNPEHASAEVNPLDPNKYPITKNQMVNLKAALSYLTKQTGVNFKIAGDKTSPDILKKAINIKMYDQLSRGMKAGYYDGQSVHIGNVDGLNRLSLGRSGSSTTIAHELLHAMGDAEESHHGSKHTKNPFDLMFPVQLPFQKMSKASRNLARNYARNFAGGGMMTMPKYEMGGMPRYNIPTDSLSVANKPFNSYANGGSAVYNNAFTINAAEGQDTRMIAMQAVQLMQKQGSKTFSEQGSPGARLI